MSWFVNSYYLLHCMHAANGASFVPINFVFWTSLNPSKDNVSASTATVRGSK